MTARNAIAAHLGISRQAVHERLKRGAKPEELLALVPAKRVVRKPYDRGARARYLSALATHRRAQRDAAKADARVLATGEALEIAWAACLEEGSRR